MKSNYLSNRVRVTIHDAVRELAEKGSVYTVIVSDPSNQTEFELIWEDANTQKAPSKQEVIDKFIAMEEDYKNSSYYRKRANEYPSIQEQLDTLYHEGYDGWKSQIQAIKDKYPKV